MKTRKADPNMSYADLAKVLLAEYELEPMTCVLTNKTRNTTIQLREGGVISTPYRSISAQVFLYIMTYKVHPSEDPPELYAERLHQTKSRLHNMQPRKPKTTWQSRQPKQASQALSVTDKIELLRQAMLAIEERLATLEANQPKEP